MANDALQAELSRLEGERERRVQIERIRYLRSGGTLSAEQKHLQDTAPQRLPESGGSRKRPATDDLAGYTKIFKSDPPKHFKGDSYQALTEFIMGTEMYFESYHQDLKDPDTAKRAIQTAATWLEEEPRQSYYRQRNTPATWEEFLTFLRGTIKDPQTRTFEATYAAQFRRQYKDQGVRQYLHELEQAENEVEASGLTETELKMWRFLHGLQTPIRNAIMAEPQEVRLSRDTVLSAACRHETRLASEQKGKAKEKDKPPQGSKKDETPRPRTLTGSTGNKPSHPNRVGNVKAAAPPTPNASAESRPKQGDKASSPPPIKCFNCRKEGHLARDCPDKGSKK